MAGAPRTTMSLMALAVSAASLQTTKRGLGRQHALIEQIEPVVVPDDGVVGMDIERGRRFHDSDPCGKVVRIVCLSAAGLSKGPSRALPVRPTLTPSRPHPCKQNS
jgi:hypothetical protein